MSIDVLKQAAIHEAGHILAARILGFSVQALKTRNGRLLLEWCPDINRPNDTCTVLAAGAAAEELLTQASDPAGRVSDETEIAQLSNRPFAFFLRRSKRLLSMQIASIQSISKTIEAAASEFEFGQPYSLLSACSNPVLLDEIELNSLTEPYLVSSSKIRS